MSNPVPRCPRLLKCLCSMLRPTIDGHMRCSLLILVDALERSVRRGSGDGSSRSRRWLLGVTPRTLRTILGLIEDLATHARARSAGCVAGSEALGHAVCLLPRRLLSMARRQARELKNVVRDRPSTVQVCAYVERGSPITHLLTLSVPVHGIRPRCFRRAKRQQATITPLTQPSLIIQCHFFP